MWCMGAVLRRVGGAVAHGDGAVARGPLAAAPGAPGARAPRAVLTQEQEYEAAQYKFTAHSVRGLASDHGARGMITSTRWANEVRALAFSHRKRRLTLRLGVCPAHEQLRSYAVWREPPPDGLTPAIYQGVAFKHLVELSVASLLHQNSCTQLLRDISMQHRRAKEPRHYGAAIPTHDESVCWQLHRLA
jgi:hypothetical protein